MKCLLIQAILAFSDGEDTGWTQLLVFVVVAVLYGLANIVKSRAQKAGRLKEEEEEKEGFKLPKTTEKAPAGTAEKKPYLKAKAPQPIVSYVSHKQPLPIVASEELVVKPLIEKEVEIVSETILPEAESTKESLVDLDDPAELRKAILHYEILSKPLSLREESG